MLTPRQRDCLEAIIAHKKAHGGDSPSFATLRELMGLSEGADISRPIERLENLGYIRRRAVGQHVAIEVLKGPPPVMRKRYCPVPGCDKVLFITNRAGICASCQSRIRSERAQKRGFRREPPVPRIVPVIHPTVTGRIFGDPVPQRSALGRELRPGE